MNNMEWLQWYLISIGVYFVTSIILINVFSDRIWENGWLDCCDDDDDTDPYMDMFITCAVPVVRVKQILTIIAMAFVTKEEYEKSLKYK